MASIKNYAQIRLRRLRASPGFSERAAADFEGEIMNITKIGRPAQIHSIEKRARDRLLNNIKNITLSNEALHDKEYGPATARLRKGLVLISLEDFGHCIGLPNLEKGLIPLFRNEQAIMNDLRTIKEALSTNGETPYLSSDQITKLGWFKSAQRESLKPIIFDGSSEEKLPQLKSYIPYMDASWTTTPPDKARYTEAFIAFLNGASTTIKRSPNPTAELMVKNIISSLAGVREHKLIYEVRAGEITRDNGKHEYVPFVALDEKILQDMLSQRAR